jgi:hypothetical protein
VLVGRAVLPAMLAEHYGRIVHVDSEAARTTPPPRAPRRGSPAPGPVSWRRSASPSTPSRPGSSRSSGTRTCRPGCWRTTWRRCRPATWDRPTTSPTR